MKIICDNCATKYSIADEKVRGKVFKIRCKKCSHIIVVRGAAKVEEPPPDEVARSFDQKETRVFDYSGFDGGDQPAAAAGAPGGAEAPPADSAAGEPPIWHVVIDREQVGPMTASEVQERFARGEVDAESYMWREGFDDWIRMANLPEFSELFAGTAAAPSPFEGGQEQAPPEQDEPLFGAPDVGVAAAAGASSDLFGGADAAAGSAVLASTPEQPEAQGGMFGGGGGGDEAGLAASSSDEDQGAAGLFASAAIGGGAPSAGGPRVEVTPLTGQRNENSVLFSLSNLSAIATGGGGPAKETPKAGPGAAADPTSSGLIDIRAMAEAAIQPTSSGLPSPTASTDDIPSFAPSFSPVAAPVLLPTASEGWPKWVWPVIGIGGALVVAIIVMVIMLVARPAATPVAPTGVIAAVPTGTTPGATAATGAPGATPAPTGAPSASGTKVAMLETKKPDETPAGAAAAAAGGTKREKPGKKPERGTKRDPKKPVKQPTRPARPERPTRPEKPAKPGGKVDQLDCLLDPTKPGCRGGGRAKPAPGGTKPAKPAADPSLKERLEPSDIQRGMRRVKTKVRNCYDRYKVPGMVQVSVTISGSGRVSGARVSGKFAGTPTGSCVASAVKAAKFDKFSGRPITITYPFVLRR